MKRLIALLCLVCLVLALGGCGNTSGFIRRNKAGTRSVALPGGTLWSEAAEDPAGDAGPFAGDWEEPPPEEGPRFLSSDGVIEIKEKLFIAQTNDVYLNPEEYMGRTIKYEGLFKSVYYEEAGDPYCFVLRYGPGCCGNDGSAGFEVAWDAAERPDLAEGAPGEFPEEDAWVEATGVLKSYEEDGYPYLYLALSSLKVLEQRGAEFVAQ
jgi:hypothetical protein